MRPALVLLASCILMLGAILVPLCADDSPRLVLIKVDGLSPLVLDAAVNPDDVATNGVPWPEHFRAAHSQLRSVLRRDSLVPNIEAHFYRHGVRARMYCSTLAVSTPSWSVIDTGRSSIVKTNSYFNRFSGDLSSYLDQLRESLSMMAGGADRTAALWQLDLLGIPIVSDYFPEGRVWTSIQPFYRERPTDQLTALAKHLITGGQKSRNPLRLLGRHLANSAYGADYPEKNDQTVASLASRKILEKDLDGKERFDFLDVFLASIDHQFHVDPHYENILTWMVRLDDWIGEILAAVHQSERRDSTLVVLLSDHGLDFDPVRLNYSFPVNRWLREPQFGTHTVLAPVVEDTELALTVPVRGVDFTRIYESPGSAFGPGVPQGEKGFVTAYTDNTGNPRFDAYLRNSDLNRLHLLLLETLRCRKQPELLDRIFPEFTISFSAVKDWLGNEIAEAHRAAEGLSQIANSVPTDTDAVRRLNAESVAYRRTAAALARLSSIPTDKPGWLSWARSGFSIPKLIPKRYFGPTNSINQLKTYITGWDTPPQTRWREPAVYRRVDYTRVFAETQAASANAHGNEYPFHFFSTAVPLELLHQESDRPLRQAVWLVFRSSEAVILESSQGEILYRPVRAVFDEDGKIKFEPSSDQSRDALGLSHLANRWMSPHLWVSHPAESSEWRLAPLILAELFRDNFKAGDPVPGRDDIQEFAREFHFEQQRPDFRVWTFRGWNVNSNSHTPGGSHGNFTELDARTTFAVWGGQNFRLRRGELLPGAFLTSDIRSTVFATIGETGSRNAGTSIRMLPIRDLRERKPDDTRTGTVIPITEPAPGSPTGPDDRRN